MAGNQTETGTSACLRILPDIVKVHVSNCDSGTQAEEGSRHKRAAKRKIPRAGRHAGFQILGWLMGLEPTTTGITILDSTN